MKYITPQAHDGLRPSVHPSQRQHHVTPVSSPLYVVTCITNPHRYYSRYKLYPGFEKQCEDAGAILYTVELATRDRHFEVTRPEHPRHLQFRSPSVIWHKENLLNVAIGRLPEDWEYVAWIDADVLFSRPDWAVETVHQLQIHKVVQMWSHATDLGPDFQPIATYSSLFATYLRERHLLKPLDRERKDGAGAVGRGSLFSDNRDCYGSVVPSAKGLLHTGFAWAARRSAIADLGGLGEIGILGSGDRHMAYALLGEVERSLYKGIPGSYGEYWLEWQARAEKFIQRNVGVVPGAIQHYWHGSKQTRRYRDRWQILIDNQYDHTKDLKKDPQGVFHLTDRNWRLRDDLLGYFAQRNEDSVDL